MYSLKFKLLFAGLLISIIPLMTYQYVTYHQSSNTLQSTYAKELQQKIDLTTLLIGNSFAHTLSDIKLVAKNFRSG